MLLADFDDIDKYLVDAGQLFSNIHSLKEIDSGFDFLTQEQIKYLSTFWSNIITSRQSSDKDQFLNIWRKLLQIYVQFNQQLEDKGWAYEGMMYRKMAGQLKNIAETDAKKQYALIGFNALNTCEKRLFSFLKSKGNTTFYWDFDSYYTEAKNHEAAHFINENLMKYPMPENFAACNHNFSN